MISFPDKASVTADDLPQPQMFSTFHPFLKGVFSQWHATPFEVGGRRFNCAEQFMMAAKASLFADVDMFEQIMATDDPALQKRLGARVRNFDDRTWMRWRVHIVHTASQAKFGQNAGAMRQLQNTVPAMLVEANPRDWNWGTGLQVDDRDNHDPALWRGANLLGRILTSVRDA